VAFLAVFVNRNLSVGDWPRCDFHANVK